MKEYTKTYFLYEYSELDEEAKEKVKRDYLSEDFRNDMFQENVLYQLKEIFPNSELKIQYSLNSCQGDGLNIYGTLNIKDIFNLTKDKFNNEISERIYLEKLSEFNPLETDEIKLPYNSKYCYDISDRIDFVEDEENTENAYKVQEWIKNLFHVLNNYFKEYGYNWFYEISDEEMQEESESNGWTYLKDGTFFTDFGDE